MHHSRLQLFETVALSQVRQALDVLPSGRDAPIDAKKGKAGDRGRASVMTLRMLNMDKFLLKVQVAVLALGTVFSWFTLFVDYRRFFAAGGRVLEVSGCAVANPLVTPCFYGALAFLAAFVWAVAVLRSAPAAMTQRQRGLNWLLTAGTVFAWGNFGYEVYRFSQPQPSASAFSCPRDEMLVNPLMTPCFYGAMIYLAALVVSMSILRARASHPWPVR